MEFLRDWRRSIWPLVALIALVAVAVLLGTSGSQKFDRATINALINMTLVVGLYIFMGNSGVLSFGHVSFMAVGAYTAGILTIPVDRKVLSLPDIWEGLRKAEWDSFEAILMAGVVAALVALVLVVPLTRLSGLAASLATLAVLVIVHVVAQNWAPVTRGLRGLTAIPKTTTVWQAFGWAVLAMVIAWMFQSSRFGLRLRASREDIIAARSVGVRVSLERGIALVLSAFLMGIGGAVFAQFFGTVNPNNFFLTITFFVLVMLVVGGATSLAGAVVGTIVVSVVSEFLLQTERGALLWWRVPSVGGLREVGLALIMVLILVLRPGGLMGGRELSWPFRRGRVDTVEMEVAAQSKGA